jgi:hypothetical protein
MKVEVMEMREVQAKEFIIEGAATRYPVLVVIMGKSPILQVVVFGRYASQIPKWYFENPSHPIDFGLSETDNEVIRVGLVKMKEEGKLF